MKTYENHRKRVTQRVAEFGADSLSDEELIETVLYFSIPRRDTVPAAKALLNEFKNISNILNAAPASLEKICGIGKNSAIYLKILNELFMRCTADINNTNKKKPVMCLKSWRDAVDYLKNIFYGCKTEKLFIINLTADCEIINKTQISEGTAYTATLKLRDLVKSAIDANAYKIIIAHNHLAGGAAPSNADVDTTIAIAKAMEPLEIFMLDHIIIAGDEYFSFLKHGIIAGSY